MNKINPKQLVFISVCALIFLLGIFIALGSKPQLSSLPPPPTTSTNKKVITTTKAHDGRNTEYFMRTKNRGTCRDLTGKVLLNFYLISDGDCLWTEKDTATFKQTTDDAVFALQRDASMFDVDLEFICNYVPITYKTKIIREEAIHGDALYKMMDDIGVTDRDTRSATLCNEFGTDSAAVIFCFNRQERSFAINTTLENEFEFCILYGSKEDFRHELLHLYGANDLYRPERINALSDRYFHDSIMRVSGGMIVDPLTAFLIGWTDTLNDTAKAFLEAVDR